MRYLRQDQIKGWIAEPIHNAKILVIGAGTVGNEIIKNLVLLGIGQITVIDYDIIEEINLNRSILFRNEDIGKSKSITAASRAKEINPQVEITGLNKDIIYDIGSQFYLEFDCVFLGVDNLEARMFTNRYCWLNEIPLINIGIEGLHGNFSMYLSPHGSCIECSWHQNEYKKLSEKFSCLKMGLSIDERKIPMVITTASVIAGMAVQECVNLLQKKFNQSDKDYYFSPKNYIYIVENEHSLIGFEKTKKEDCPGHRILREDLDIVPIKFELTNKVNYIQEIIKELYQAEQVEISIDKEIIYSFDCKQCGVIKIDKPIYLGKYKRILCQKCGTHELRPLAISNQLYSDYSLMELNIPTAHLLECHYLKNDNIKDCWIETI